MFLAKVLPNLWQRRLEKTFYVVYTHATAFKELWAIVCAICSYIRLDGRNWSSATLPSQYGFIIICTLFLACTWQSSVISDLAGIRTRDLFHVKQEWIPKRSYHQKLPGMYIFATISFANYTQGILWLRFLQANYTLGNVSRVGTALSVTPVLLSVQNLGFFALNFIRVILVVASLKLPIFWRFGWKRVGLGLPPYSGYDPVEIESDVMLLLGATPKGLIFHLKFQFPEVISSEIKIVLNILVLI